MALDATVGGATANSYLSVADADAAADVDLGRYSEKWVAAPLDRKERALMRATREISRHLGPQSRYSTTQALPFPRSIDYTGVEPAVTPFLPADLVRATFEQAIFLNANAEVLDDAATRRAQGTFSQSDDSGSYSLAVDPQLGRMAPEALAALASLRAIARGSARTIQSVRLASSLYASEVV